MNNAIKIGFSFIFGGAIGFAVATYIQKKKFEKRIDSEIALMKESEKEFKKSVDDEAKAAEPDPVEPVPNDNMAASKREYVDYTAYSKPAVNNVEPEQAVSNGSPTLINPDSFGENLDYDSTTLLYYKDDVLTEDMSSEKLNIDEYIGYENLEHFGDYMGDILYIRNDAKKMDYEVLRVDRTYNEDYPD